MLIFLKHDKGRGIACMGGARLGWGRVEEGKGVVFDTIQMLLVMVAYSRTNTTLPMQRALPAHDPRAK